MTTYIAAYDTESPECLPGVRRIVKAHEQHEIPATFFMVAGLLDHQAGEYQALLRDHPLFEIACHSYSHMPLVDTPKYGKGGAAERYPRELVESKKKLEDTFECTVTGFRPPVCAPDGLKSVPAALETLRGAGYRYISSVAWGPDFSLPAPLTEPFTYAQQGFPDLWELPPCGWHENLLKGHNNMGAVLVGLFPSPTPAAMPRDYVKSPYEEFAVNNRPFLDQAVQRKASHVSFIWHPWSLVMLDPKMRMLELTFNYIKYIGVRAADFRGLHAKLTMEKVRDNFHASQLKGRAVLVVEDEDTVRHLVVTILEEYGFEVLKASNAMEALALAEQYSGHLDLLVSDVIMPKMNGKELYHRLAFSRPDIRVLYMSGNTGGTVLNYGPQDAKFNFIEKPFSIHELIRKVRESLELD